MSFFFWIAFVIRFQSASDLLEAHYSRRDNLHPMTTIHSNDAEMRRVALVSLSA